MILVNARCNSSKKSKERNESGLCLAELRNTSYATIKLLLQVCLLQFYLINGCN